MTPIPKRYEGPWEEERSYDEGVVVSHQEAFWQAASLVEGVPPGEKDSWEQIGTAPPNFRGLWDDTVAYSVDDAVWHPDQYWRATTESKGSAPTTKNASWEPLAADSLAAQETEQPTPSPEPIPPCPTTTPAGPQGVPLPDQLWGDVREDEQQGLPSEKRRPPIQLSGRVCPGETDTYLINVGEYWPAQPRSLVVRASVNDLSADFNGTRIAERDGVRVCIAPPTNDCSSYTEDAGSAAWRSEWTDSGADDKRTLTVEVRGPIATSSSTPSDYQLTVRGGEQPPPG